MAHGKKKKKKSLERILFLSLSFSLLSAEMKKNKPKCLLLSSFLLIYKAIGLCVTHPMAMLHLPIIPMVHLSPSCG